MAQGDGALPPTPPGTDVVAASPDEPRRPRWGCWEAPVADLRSLVRAIERRDMSRPRSRARRFVQACRTARRSLAKRTSAAYVASLPRAMVASSVERSGLASPGVCALDLSFFARPW